MLDDSTVVRIFWFIWITKFHSDVLWPQCKDNVKWVGNFFYRSSLSCFFLENFALNDMQILYL